MDNNVSDALFSEAVSKLNPSNSDLFEEIAVEKEVPLQVRCTAIGRLNFADHSIELIDFASDKEQDVSIRMAAVENFGMDCDGILEPLIVDRGENPEFRVFAISRLYAAHGFLLDITIDKQEDLQVRIAALNKFDFDRHSQILMRFIEDTNEMELLRIAAIEKVAINSTVLEVLARILLEEKNIPIVRKAIVGKLITVIKNLNDSVVSC